jgi:hypothetical protein
MHTMRHGHVQESQVANHKIITLKKSLFHDSQNGVHSNACGEAVSYFCLFGNTNPVRFS